MTRHRQTGLSTTAAAGVGLPAADHTPSSNARVRGSQLCRLGTSESRNCTFILEANPTSKKTPAQRERGKSPRRSVGSATMEHVSLGGGRERPSPVLELSYPRNRCQIHCLWDNLCVLERDQTRVCAMKIQKKLLLRVGTKQAVVSKYLNDLQALLPAHGIDTELRVAHFLAQVLHESSMMGRVVENLNYSADGLRSVFRKYFTPAQAAAYARKPKTIGSRAYANRLGNGNEASGEGFLYRGRGLILNRAEFTGGSNS